MDEIRSVYITEEAKDEFLDICGYDLPDTIKNEINYYLRKKESVRDYFKIKYLDEETGKELFLFFRKGNKFVDMQTYNLCGICETQHWSQELEDDGSIKSWLDATYDKLLKIPDWVSVWRLAQIEKLKKDLEDPYCEQYYRNRGVFEKLPQIFESIAEYLSSPTEDWETFARRIRKLTGEKGFGRFRY